MCISGILSLGNLEGAGSWILTSLSQGQISPSSSGSAKGKESIDIVTAFNIWSLLPTRYQNIETIHLIRNFIHDRDLAVVANEVLDDYDAQVTVLESEAEFFQIKVPERPSFDGTTSKNLDIYTDQHIYDTLYNDVRADLFTVSRTVRTSTTNDRTEPA